MKHKCNYCEESSNENRDALVEAGWSFVSIRAPIRRYLKSCPQHYLELYDDINGVFKPESRSLKP